MYKPHYQMSQNQLPILSRDQIDDIAESYLADFQPEALKEPMEVDVEGFLEIYLGITPDFQYLSHNMIYLGMAVFHDTNRIPVYDPLLNRAEYFSAKANTAIFDRRLVEEKNQEHRFRFTCGHESGHFVYHSPYFKRVRHIQELFGAKSDSFVQCYHTDLGDKSKRRLKTDNDWLEWQANQFSSSLLMPKAAVLSILESNGTDNYGIWQTLFEMQNIFNVSYEAAKNRLRGWGLLNKSLTKTTVSV